jgi:hypothetical protein
MGNPDSANYSQQAALFWYSYHTFPIHTMTYITFRPPQFVPAASSLAGEGLL